MAGVGDMTFAPTQDVTRAMFVTVLAAYAEADTDNNAPAFSDTGAGKWYTGAAAWASQMEIVKGIGDGRFAPNRAITRQDLCTMLYKYIKVAGIQLKADSDRTYADYNSVAAYAKEAVGFCAASGLVTGFEDSSFRPRSTATRAQVAQILMRLDMLRKGQELPDEPMPAQSFDGEAGEDMSVAVNAPEGALPENTKMTVSRVTDEAALAAIKEKVCTDVLAAADITFTKDGEEIEPNEEVEVQISLEGLDESKTPTVVHVRPDGNVEYIDGVELINPNRSGEGKVVRFYAQSFSVYALLPDDNIGGADKITITFHARNNQKAGPSGNDEDWKVINKQVIYPSQIQKVKNALTDDDPTNDNVVLVYDPGLPDLKDSQSFEGWTLDPNFTESTKGKTVEDINDKILADYEAQQAGTGSLLTNVDEYAIVYDVIYVVYHDQAGAVLRTDYKHLDARTNTAPADIDESYIPFKGNQTFTGWVTEDKVATMGDVPVYNAVADNEVYKVGETYDISETLQLYPYVQKGFWLSFNNNLQANNNALGFEDDTRAEYISPKFYAEGVAPGQAPAFSSAADKIRLGYTFGGWYVDPEMTDEYDFTKPLTQDTTVYAKWNRAETTYRVVFWQQKPTDDINAYNTAAEGSPVKSWDYYVPSTVSVERTATTGTMVSLSNDDKQLGNRNSTTNYGEMGYFFDFNSELSTNGSVRVAGDGSTVLNAYYNRKVITINFRTAWTQVYWDDYVSRGYDSSIGYYRWDIYFNVNQTHRDGTGTSSNILTLTTPEGSDYPDEDGWVYAGYVYSSSSSGTNLSLNSSGSQCVWMRNGSTYTGNVYGYDMGTDATASSPIWYTYQGLYKAPLTWPGGNMTSNSWKIDYAEENGASYFLTPRDNSDIMDAKYTTTYDLYLVTETESNPKTIHWMKEKADSDDFTGVNKYEEAFTTVINDNYNSQSYTVNKFMGFTAYGHNLTQNSLTSGFVQPTSEANMKLLYSNMGSNSYIYYNRNRYHLNFVSNNHTLVYNSSDPTIAIPASYPDPNSVAYEKELEDYDGFVPANGPEGYYFAGWYADPGYSRTFDFKTEKMQNNDVTVYAKWNPKWYRVVVDYKWSDPSMTVTVPGTTQRASFTVEYGKEIQASALLKAHRDDYLLLGLYFDKEGKRPFNPYTLAPFGLNEAAEVYPDSERTGVDDLTGNTWSDVGYPDVRAKITLYALWRADPDGTIGYNVRYEGDQNEHDTGYFDVDEDPKPHIVEDEMTYVDRAQAYAHPASIPEVEGEQFLYWEVLDADYNPTGQKAYPGGTFTIRAEDASIIRERLPDPRCPHTEKTLVPAVEPTCTRSGHNAYYECNACHKKFETMASTEEYDPTIPALGHNWGEWVVTTAPKCNAEGEETRTCSRCQLTETRVLSMVAHTLGGWSYSSTGHWQECSVCQQHLNGAAHQMEEDTNQYLAPTQSSEGKHVYVCSVCGYTVEETIPPVQEVTLTYSVPAAVPAVPSVTQQSNTEVTLASATAPAGYSFLGWVEAQVPSTTAQPQEILAAGSSYTLERDVTLYGLFSHEETGAPVTCYEQVTAAPSSWVGNYVITYLNTTELFAMQAVNGSAGGSTYETSGTGVAYANTGMTLNGSKLYNVPSNYVFAIAAQGSYYSIQSVSNSAYVGRYATSTSKSASMRSFSTYNSTYCQWNAPELQTDGNVRIQNNYQTSDTYYTYFGFNNNTTSEAYPCFWVDGLGENTDSPAALNIYLWRETTETESTTYYSTEIDGYTVSFTVPSTVEAVNPVSCAAGGSVTLPSAQAPNGYTFLGWVENTVDNATTAPADVHTGSYTPNSNITFKALYSYETGTGSYEGYQLVTEAPSSWANDYVITQGNTASAMNVLTGISGTTNYESTSSGGSTAFASTGIVLDNNVLTNVANKYVFTVSAQANSQFAIQNKSTSTYLRHYPSGTSYRLYSDTADSTTYARWTFTMNGANVTVMNSYQSRYLSHSTSGYFMLIGSAGNTYLWAKTTITDSTTYYTTVIAGATATWTVDFTVPECQGLTAPAAQTPVQGDSITLPTAEAPSGYSFLGWVTDEVDNSATQPAQILTGSYTPTADVTLKALYSYTGSTRDGYKLSTVAPAAGDKLILAGNDTRGSYYGFPYISSSSSSVTGTALTLTDGFVDNTANLVWEVYSGANGLYLIKEGETSTNALKLNSSAFNYNGRSDSNGTSNTGALSFTAFGGGFDISGTYNTGRHMSFSGTTFTVGSSASTVYVFKYQQGTVGGTVYTTVISSGTASTYTVTYMANGSQYRQDEVAEGGTVTLPAGLAAVNGYSFAGWYAGALSETSTQPALLTGAYQPNGSVTLYAVYTKSTGGSTSWTAISSASGLVSGDYVIGWIKNSDSSTVYYLPSETDKSNPNATTGITVNSGTITSTVSSNMQWTFTGDNTNGFNVSHTSGSTTHYLSAKNDAQGIKVQTTDPGASGYDSYYNSWKASDDTTYGILLKSADTGSRNLAVNADNNTWRYYSRGTYYTGKLQLYKKTVSSGGTTYWTSDPANGAHSVTEPKNEDINLFKHGDPEEPTRAFPIDGSHSVPTETYYVEVTQPIPGEKYLIAYESGSTVKIVGNTYPTGLSYNISPVDASSSAHGSYGYTLTASGADLSDYLYTVGGSSGAYTFYNEEKGYLAFNDGGYPILTTSATASYRTWSWSTSTGLKNATWTGDAYTYFRYYTNNGYFAAMNSGASTTKLYKPVTVDVVSSGDTIIYQLASAPEAGKQYVIVIGDHAMTSNAFNTSNHGFAPLSVTFSGDTVIVPDASADSVLWYADGNSSDGFTFLNLASNKYVSLNSSDEYWLYPGSTGWAWTYDGTDLNNHCSEADNAYTTGGTDYYYYLSKNTSTSSGVYFTTSTGTGHNVKFYERIVSNTPSHTLTIHYVLAGGGTAASDYIATVIEGDPYSVTSPTIPGYNPNPAVVSGTMGSSDVEITVEYSSNVVNNEKWEEVTEIDDLDVPYLIGIEVNGTVYLVVDYNALNNSNYYAGSTNYAYLAPAVFGTGSDSAKIIGVAGTAANDLNNCEWKFETTGGGTVTGVTSNRKLYYTNAGGVYPYTSGDSYTFNGGSHRMYTGTHYLYAANVNGTYYLGNTTSANAGTVRIYKQVIDEDTVFTVHFQDEEGNDIIGFPDQPVQNVENARVQDPGDPNAAVHGNDGANDWYFLGWYEPGANAEYDFANTPVTGDLTLEARFSYAWEVKYTITLRAVYGMINTTGDTHIYWYANDGTDAGHGAGAGDRYESCALNEDTNEYENHIPMNEPTPIPYPAPCNPAPYSGYKVWTGIESEQEGLYYPGHTFLGWARLETDGAGVSGEGHPELTEADLYLKWDEANHQYLYNSNGTRDLTPNWEPLPSGKVYATEDTPYHDMYAVWAPGNFYVFHSATGKIEAIDTLAVRNSDSGVIDLTQHVTPGYIYGGYYLEKTNGDQQLSGYGYISPAEMRSVLRGFEVGNTAQWATMTASAPDDPVAAHVITAADLSAGSNFETYTGAYRYTNGTNLAICKDANGNIIKENGKPKLAPAIWNKASAANAANGDAQGNQISPVPGTVYYLKEVPSTYLTSKVAYSYDLNTADIQEIWLLTLADDSNYSQIGFKTVNGQDAEALDDAKLEKANAVTKAFTLKPAAPSNGGPALSDPVTFTSADFGFKDGEAGYIAVTRAQDFINEGKPSFSMLPGWVTLDGIAIYNNGTYWHYIEDAAENAQIGWSRVYDGTEKLYIDVNGGQQIDAGWATAEAKIWVRFYETAGDYTNNCSEWVLAEKTGDGDIRALAVPQGNWKYFRIARFEPNTTPATDNFWNATQQMPIRSFSDNGASNENFITKFWKEGTVCDWSHYPAFPS